MKPKRKPRAFNRKTSYRLDRAIEAKERGHWYGHILKFFLEWWIFGGKT